MNMPEMTTMEELQETLEKSQQRPQLIFKHSLTCPVSSAADKAVRSYLEEEPSEAIDYWWIAVQRSRPVSKEVERVLEVRHESPQVLLVSGGKAVWNDSHFSITAAALTEAITGNVA
ncbi:MAG: bacillithiol system redox-active protein YtxJ [Deltaproteobacteria bacterium]|nr:bacillithiol system redox-active protein YtxJ [Deltaproteobacteria bacterium]